MSVEDHTVSFSLEVNVEKAYENVRKLQTILYRTLGLIRRMGLSEELDAQIAQIQRVIAIVNSLRLTYAALQAARMAAGDPVAWAMAGVSVGTFMMEINDWAGMDYQNMEWTSH